MPMLLRFVTARKDGQSGKRQGVFQIVDEVRTNSEIPVQVASELQEISDWFDKHLKKPARLAVSRRPHAQAQAMSLFKASAEEHLKQVRRLLSLLEAQGIIIEVLRTDRPGYIVYEDEFQVAAYPFSDTPT